MEKKFRFYQRHGVEEYYVYDPDNGNLQGYLRQGTELVEQLPMQGWTSPRLQVRFQLVGNDLELYRPDGSRFAAGAEEYAQKKQESQRAEREAQRAEREAQRAEREAQRAEREAQRAAQEQAEKERLLREAEEQKRRAEAQAEQLARLQARLKELGLDPEA
jgi:DNA repair exonuclease SbcCD ATPase subunit